MATYTPQFNHLVEADKKMIFFKAYTQQSQKFPMLFDRKTSMQAYEEGVRIAALGTFTQKNEGTPIAFDDPAQGTLKRVAHTAFALGHRMSYEMRRDDQHAVMNKMASDLGDSARDHQERVAWDVINDGTTGARHTVLEGETLFSTTHTLLKTGGTASNLQSPPLALDQASIEAVMTQAQLTQSDEGRYIELTQGILLVHPNNEHNAYVLLNTEFRPGTADNDRSTVVSSRSGLKPLSVPFLTSTTGWGIFSGVGKNGLTWWDRDELMFNSAPDADTMDQKNYGYYRAMAEVFEWRGSWWSAA